MIQPPSTPYRDVILIFWNRKIQVNRFDHVASTLAHNAQTRDTAELSLFTKEQRKLPSPKKHFSFEKIKYLSFWGNFMSITLPVAPTEFRADIFHSKATDLNSVRYCTRSELKSVLEYIRIYLIDFGLYCIYNKHGSRPLGQSRIKLINFRLY